MVGGCCENFFFFLHNVEKTIALGLGFHLGVCVVLTGGGTEACCETGADCACLGKYLWPPWGV